jgi:hypothetical protein
MNVSLSDLPGFFYDRQLIEGIDNAMSTYSFMLWKYWVLFVHSAIFASHYMLTCIFLFVRPRKHEVVASHHRPIEQRTCRH